MCANIRAESLLVRRLGLICADLRLYRRSARQRGTAILHRTSGTVYVWELLMNAGAALSLSLVHQCAFLLDKKVLSMSFSIIRDSLLLASLLSWLSLGGGLALGALGDGLDLLADGEASSLAVNHNLEALVVGEVGTGVLKSQLLGERHGIPLGSETLLLDGLAKGSSAGTALNVELQLGERESAHGHHHSGEVLSVNEDAVLVGNVDDGDLLAVVCSVVNERNSACFNKVLISLHTKQRKKVSK